nr:MAG TPA: hypothetical protein [Caudoviricetes sp.]
MPSFPKFNRRTANGGRNSLARQCQDRLGA